MRFALLGLFLLFGCAETRLVRLRGVTPNDRSDVRFVLLDQQWQPLREHLIEVTLDGRVIASAITDKQGVAQMTMPPGAYTLKFSWRGFDIGEKSDWRIGPGRWRYRMIWFVVD